MHIIWFPWSKHFCDSWREECFLKLTENVCIKIMQVFKKYLEQHKCIFWLIILKTFKKNIHSFFIGNSDPQREGVTQRKVPHWPACSLSNPDSQGWADRKPGHHSPTRASMQVQGFKVLGCPPPHSHTTSIVVWGVQQPGHEPKPMWDHGAWNARTPATRLLCETL